MELATRIFRKNKTNRIGYFIDQFKLLGLGKKHCEDINEFDSYIENNKVKITINNLLNNLYKTNDTEELANSILMAYKISLFSKDVFSGLFTKLDKKIVNSSHKVVAMMELLQENISDDFFETINQHYSLYKLWSSKHILHRIRNEIQNLTQLLKIKTSLKKNEYQNIISDICDYVDKIINEDAFIGVKSILDIYPCLSVWDNAKQYYWTSIKLCHDDIYHLFVLLISELKKKLDESTSCKSIKDQLNKDLNINKMTKMIRDNNFNTKDIVNITDKVIIIAEKIYPDLKFNHEIDSFCDSIDALSVIFDQ